MGQFNPSILRASDIRGKVGDTLNPADALLLGRCFARALRSHFPQKETLKVGVARDGRLTSPLLEEALITGLREGGVQVKALGLGPTPLLYYGVKKEGWEGGIMITGSHNPADYNGFKLLLNHRPFFGPDIQNLQKLALSLPEDFLSTDQWGEVTFHDLRAPYVDRLLENTCLSSPGRSLRIAWDPGNGAVGAILPLLLKKIQGDHHVINEEVNGLFPAHHPDPTLPENLEEIRQVVLQKKCDLGIAFDGDGDRIGVIDGEGDILWGDQLLAFYSEDLLERHPGATIIADVKASQVLFDWVQEKGGIPLMVPTGHSLVKSHMAQTGALLAGEMSGHIFFAEDYYGYDDAIYAAVRLLHILAQGKKDLLEFKRRLPVTFNTPEIRFPCADDIKFSVIDLVKNILNEAGEIYTSIDGARVQTSEGWWLLRASNTQDVLVARCESSSPQGLAHLQTHLHHILEEVSQKIPEFSPPLTQKKKIS